MANDPKTLPEGLKKDTTTGMGRNIQKLGQQGRGPQGRGKKDKKPEFIIVIDGKQYDIQNMAKGGRAGYKSGGRGCKLAMKGKGRAYGKNS